MRPVAMFNLFDIMQNEAGGIYGLGQQFGLSPDQSRRAMEALLPALTIGLQRNAANDPAGLGRMFGLVGAEQPQGGASASPPHLDLLGQLFGSPALAQAVLQQTASASGIGTQALRQMLPIMAGMVVAGIVHVMLNQPPPAQPVRRQPEPLPPPAAFPDTGFWNDWMNTFLSSTEPTSSSKPDTPARRPERDEPRSLPAPERRHADEAPKAEPDASTEFLQQMFQSGVQVQEQNVKAMQDLFDCFWSAPTENTAEAATPSPTGVADPASKPTRPSRKGRGKSGDVS